MGYRPCFGNQKVLPTKNKGLGSKNKSVKVFIKFGKLNNVYYIWINN